MSHTEPSPNGGYETSDVNPRTLLYWVAGLAGVLVLAVFSALIIFDALAAHAKRTDPKVSALAVAQSALPPPEPRLLDNEPKDLRSVRQQEDQTLESYDWIDKEHAIVRVPIARALELLAKEGLPSRASSSKAP